MFALSVCLSLETCEVVVVTLVACCKDVCHQNCRTAPTSHLGVNHRIANHGRRAAGRRPVVSHDCSHGSAGDGGAEATRAFRGQEQDGLHGRVLQPVEQTSQALSGAGALSKPYQAKFAQHRLGYTCDLRLLLGLALAAPAPGRLAAVARTCTWAVLPPLRRPRCA